MNRDEPGTATDRCIPTEPTELRLLEVPPPDLSRQGQRGLRPTGRVALGSPEHLQLMCLELLETHDPYRPAIIDWPKLDDETRRRIISLPVWDVAVATEERAGKNVYTFGQGLPEGLLRETVMMDAFEESRHKRVLAAMVAAYDIELEPEPDYIAPRDPEWAFMVTGYSECIDSFFGFGLFDLAKNSGFFPDALVDTFEPVMREEGRHILFFVNWVAWWRRNMPWWRRPWFEIKVVAVWLFLIWERISIAKGMENSQKARDNNFTLNGSRELGVEISFGGLARICLKEHARRVAPYDPRLIRPKLVPAVMRLITKILPREPEPAP